MAALSIASMLKLGAADRDWHRLLSELGGAAMGTLLLYVGWTGRDPYAKDSERGDSPPQ